jgi:hypothetical protein
MEPLSNTHGNCLLSAGSVVEFIELSPNQQEYVVDLKRRVKKKFGKSE